MRTNVLPIALVTLALAATTARGGTVTLVVDGEPALRPKVHAAAVDWIGHTTWSLGQHELDGGSARKLADCLLGNKDEGCFSTITQGAGTDRTLFVEAAVDQPTNGSGTVVLTGWLLTREGHFLATERQYCERCTDDGVTKATRDLLDLVVRSAAIKLGTTVLRVHSVPTGARVMVDNQAMGVTDLDFATYPGPHTISVDKPGFEIAVRNVNAQEDAKTDVDVQLKPAATSTSNAPTTHHGRGVAPWLLMGAGIVGVAGGGVLYAMNEKAPTANGDEKFQRTNTLLPSILVAGGGAALFAGGLYLYVSRGHDDTGANAVAVGLGGSF